MNGALGRIDGVVIAEVWGAVDGWIVHPDHAIDRVQVRVNGRPLGEAGLDLRPDVGAVFPQVAHAGRCRFLAQGPVENLQAQPLHIEVIGHVAGSPVARLDVHWLDGPLALLAAPDEPLRERVSGRRDAENFGRTGYCIAAQLVDAVRAHAAGQDAPRLLDWGCGSGRATRFLPRLWPAPALTGCDIDAEAVAWCRANIAGRFDATLPYPPLPYADAAFDVVVGSSVMTHLAAPVQRDWLREIRRVLAPGGLFVTSVLGSLAATGLPAAERAALVRDGICDSMPDAALDGIAPANYYRSTYQTEAHVRQVWGTFFDIVSYREGGLTNYQDLVVMRYR